MRVSSKISLLIFFLLAALAVNSFVGLSRLSRIDYELKTVANKNVVLTEIATSIAHGQLEKAVLFERAVRIAEEVGFETVTDVRKKHLLYVAGFLRDGFNQISEKGAASIISGKEFIARHLALNPSPITQKELLRSQQSLEAIEKAHIADDALFKEILVAIAEDRYQLSIEDIDEMRERGQRLSAKLDSFLQELQGDTRQSMARADRQRRQAAQFLWISFAVCLGIGLIVTLFIIRSIAPPLKKLVAASHQIGSGNYEISLKDTSKDEIGDLSRAFNLMSAKLQSAKVELENKNRELANSLEITQSQKTDLEKVNRELDNFVHSINHDIRNPLSGVAGYSAILHSKYSDKFDEQGRKCLDGLQKSTQRLTAMVEDLINLTRITRIKNPYEEVDINKILRTALEHSEFKINERRVKTLVQDNIPMIFCDRIKIQEVFSELIGNAIKFFPDDAPGKLQLEIGYSDKGEEYEFYVRDNGPGIDPAHHKTIFNIFTRLNKSEKYDGTGVGLSIVKGAVEGHGGRVWVDSQLGKGAIFYFTIPKNLRA